MGIYENDLQAYILASGKRAFSNIDCPSLVAITYSITGDVFNLFAYFEEGASEDDCDFVDACFGEVVADLPGFRWFEFNAIILKQGEEPKTETQWLYKAGKLI